MNAEIQFQRLCMLSIESEFFTRLVCQFLAPLSEALREFMGVAESTQSAVAGRNLLSVGYEEQQHETESKNQEDYASGSGTCHHVTAHDPDAS